MNIILAEPEEIDGSRLQLTDHRAEHLIKILRSKVGDRVRTGLINGQMGTGTVTVIKKKYPFFIELHLDLNESPSKTPVLDLILALPRPIMLKRILDQVTALGVGTVHLINASRVEKSFWQAGILHPQEYRLHLIHGLEQAIDTRLPEIRIHSKFRPFIEGFFPNLDENYGHLILGHPRGEYLPNDIVDGNKGRAVLAVGPEGGWNDYEVIKFKEQGFRCCSMGERILKVDTAVIALHSMISILQKMARQ